MKRCEYWKHHWNYRNTSLCCRNDSYELFDVVESGAFGFVFALHDSENHTSPHTHLAFRGAFSPTDIPPPQTPRFSYEQFVSVHVYGPYPLYGYENHSLSPHGGRYARIW